MDLLTLLYTLSGIVFGAAFLPQITTLIKDQTGAASISLKTWMLFSWTSLIGFAYALTHSGDAYFVFCSAIAVAGNTLVLGLATYKRLNFARVVAK